MYKCPKCGATSNNSKDVFLKYFCMNCVGKK